MKNYFWRVLELDKLFSSNGFTYKAMADNLRMYPVLVVLWLAIAYLWSSGGLIGQAVAVLWAFWVGLATVLNSFQSAMLVGVFVIDFIAPGHARNKTMPSDTTITVLAMVATFFLFSSAVFAVAIYHALRG